MSDELEIINVGSRVNPPAEIWVSHCPAEFQHVAPRLIKKLSENARALFGLGS